MAGLAGFEPAPPPLVVGSIESNGKNVGQKVGGIERLSRGNSLFFCLKQGRFISTVICYKIF
jgi:hypothetical protein